MAAAKQKHEAAAAQVEAPAPSPAPSVEAAQPPTPEPPPPPAAPEEQPPAGCVFMWRKHPETGATQRAEVENVTGSVEILAAIGWTLDPMKD